MLIIKASAPTDLCDILCFINKTSKKHIRLYYSTILGCETNSTATVKQKSQHVCYVSQKVKEYKLRVEHYYRLKVIVKKRKMLTLWSIMTKCIWKNTNISALIILFLFVAV